MDRKMLHLQCELTGALIGLARASDGNEDKITESTNRVLMEGLCATLANVNLDNEFISQLIARVQKEKQALIPQCSECAAPCGRNDDYDLTRLWKANKDIRSLKSFILFGIRGIAAHVCSAVPDCKIKDISRSLYKALFAIGMDDWGMEELLPIVMEVGEITRKIFQDYSSPAFSHSSTIKSREP